MFLPSAQRRMSAVGRMEKQTAHPNPNLEPIEKPHVAYRVSRGTTPAYTPHERRTKWQRQLPNPGGRRRRCTDSGLPVDPTPRRDIFMNGWKKRIFEVLGRIVGFVTANPDLFGKAREKTAPSMTVIQTRKTLTNIKTTKRSKGESQ